jgi:hypothetical protein
MDIALSSGQETTLSSEKQPQIPTQIHLHGVDPSLLFSSPTKAVEMAQSSETDARVTDARVLHEDILQPYAYQVQEARREKAHSGVVKQKRRRKPSVDSPAVKAALEKLRESDERRPGMQRSVTDSVVQKSFLRSQSNGRSSPIKQFAGSISRPPSRSAQRTSIALTIDANGRARTETRTIPEETLLTASLMDVDNGSDGESSSSEGNASDAMVTSFARSFNNPFPNSHKTHRSSLAGISHSHHTSHASSRSNQSGSLGLLAGHEVASTSETETSEDGDGSAQHELRKMRRDQRRSTNLPKTTSSASPLSNVDPNSDAALMAALQSPAVNIRCVCHAVHQNGQMLRW